MFVEASTIYPHSDPLTKGVKCVRLPLYSSRVELVDCREKAAFDTLSQRVISKHVDKNIYDILDGAGKKLLLLYLKVAFSFWYNIINRDWVSHKSWYKRYYPKLISDGVTPLWAHRKGLQIVVPYFMEIYRKQTRRAMRIWKLFIFEIRILMIRMFNKWLVKASRWKLNRLNAARFLQLTTPWGLRIRRAMRRYWWAVFRRACDLVLIRRHVRLLFRCWRTVTTAMILGRKRIKHRTLVILWENRSAERNRQEAMRKACEETAARYAQRRAWYRWQHALHARQLIKKVLWTYCDGALRWAWRAWAHSEYALSPPRPASPRRLPPPAPASPQKPTPGYRRRGSRLPRVPPHIVVPLMGLHSYALVHTPGVTAKDRIEFRIHRAGHIADIVEQHIEEYKAALPELTEENDTPAYNNNTNTSTNTSRVLLGTESSSAAPVSAGSKSRTSTKTPTSTKRPGHGGIGGIGFSAPRGGGSGGGVGSKVMKTPVRSASAQIASVKRTPPSTTSTTRLLARTPNPDPHPYFGIQNTPPRHNYGGVVRSASAAGTREGVGTGAGAVRSKPPLSARKKLQ